MYGKQIVNHVRGAVGRYVSLGLATRAAKGIDSLNPAALTKQGREQGQDVLAPDTVDAAFAEASSDFAGAKSPCENCGVPVPGKYCYVCGQRNRDIRGPLWSFFADLNDDVLSLDSRLVKTLVPLLFLPGALTRSFWEGRRARYVPPVRLYLFSSLFFFLVVMVADVAILKFNFTPAKTGEETAEVAEIEVPDTGSELGIVAMPDLEGVKDRLSDAQIEKLRQIESRADEGRVIAVGAGRAGSSGLKGSWDVEMFAPLSDDDEVTVLEDDLFKDDIEDIKVEEQEAREAGDDPEAWLLGFTRKVVKGLGRAANDPGKLNGTLNDALPWAMIFLLPVFAFMLRIFYWGRDHRVVKQLIFSLHFHSYIFLVLSFLIIAQAVWGGVVSGWMFLAAVPLYLFLALKVASRQGWFRTIFKFLFVAFFYMIIMSLTLTTTVLVGLSEL